MDRADFQQAVFQQLADAQVLGTGKRKIDFAGDATSNRSSSRRRCFSLRRRVHRGSGDIVVVMTTSQVRCRGITLEVLRGGINKAQRRTVTVSVTIRR